MTEFLPSPIFGLAGKRVYVAGHTGMVGSAIVRRLKCERCTILTADRETVDLRRQVEIEKWIDAVRPDVVILAAG